MKKFLTSLSIWAKISGKKPTQEHKMISLIDQFWKSLDKSRKSQEIKPIETCSDKQKVRELAYKKWQQAGEPNGDGVNFWLDAEKELAVQWVEALTSGDFVETDH